MTSKTHNSDSITHDFRGQPSLYRYLIVYSFADGFISDESVDATSFMDAVAALRANHTEEIISYTLMRKDKLADGQPSPTPPNRDTQFFHEALKGRDPRDLTTKQLSQALRDAQVLKEQQICDGCEATGVDTKPVPDTDLMMCAECRDSVMRAHGERL